MRLNLCEQLSERPRRILLQLSSAHSLKDLFMKKGAPLKTRPDTQEPTLCRLELETCGELKLPLSNEEVAGKRSGLKLRSESQCCSSKIVGTGVNIDNL